MGLSRAKVIAAAVELVEQYGLDALSMRKLGEALGVEAMSVYRHVRSKSDLLDALRDEVLTDISWGKRNARWDSEIRSLARALRSALLARPRLAPLFAEHPAITPAGLPLADRAVGALADAGLTPADRVAAYEALLAFVIGHALLEVGTANASFGALELDANAHPSLHTVRGALAKHTRGAAFELGLDVFIAGLASRIRRAKH